MKVDGVCVTVYKEMAQLLGWSYVGCPTYHFILTVTNFMARYKNAIKNVFIRMVKLPNFIFLFILPFQNELWWSSALAVLWRYWENRLFVKKIEINDTVPLVPNHVQIRQIDGVLDSLRLLDLVKKLLRAELTRKASVRYLFNAAI